MTYTVLQGRQVTLTVEWRDYPGGPASPVTGVTIEIKSAAGGAAVIGPTAVGVAHVATGLDSFTWTVPVAQTPADYAAIWSGVDAQGDTVTATDIVTVAAQSPPINGAYATVADLNEHLGRTPTNAAQLLVRASRDVDKALLCTVYDATLQTVIDALREATLEQVAANLDNGNTTGNGAARPGGFTLGRLAVQAPAVTAAEGGPKQIGPLWEQAWNVLQQAGLTGYGPQTG